MSFSRRVLQLTSQIPKGKVSTYLLLARAAGNAKAARAVGNALNANPAPVKVPCHRVVCSDGKIGGYVFGVKKKILLLEKEGVKVKNGRILDFEKRLFKF
ncbi:MAG: MGMT family protein [Candidatus Diapherotrites archaeon]|nr:MGMT family protein [Candidatus Diapherotrites archaeon]